MGKITEEKQVLLSDYQVRKSKKQKSKFIEYVKEKARKNSWNVNVEKSGLLIKNRNIIVGDVDKAKMIFTAHYDTCAISPFPNRIWIKNPIMYWVYQTLIVAITLAFGFAVSLLFAVCIGTADYALIVFEGALVLLLIQMLFGFRNGKTANDNTSGVLTLLTAIEKIPRNERDSVAFVFFDNEEKGLFGSSHFKKMHSSLKCKYLINFDCVGEGNNVFLFYNKKVDKEGITELQNAFPKTNEYNIQSIRNRALNFPSDQMHFSNGIGVTTARKFLFGGYTVGRLHTMRDKKLEENNIKHLVLWIKKVVKEDNEKEKERIKNKNSGRKKKHRKVT